MQCPHAFTPEFSRNETRSEMCIVPSSELYDGFGGRQRPRLESTSKKRFPRSAT